MAKLPGGEMTGYQKKKPFIVFKGPKRDVKRLNEEYQSKCIVASSDSG